MNRTILVFIIIFFLLILGMFCIVRMGEVSETFYPSFYAAKSAGAFDAGWIPGVIPESSYDIYERHDLDTNTVWVKFKFDERDSNKLLSQIEEVKPDEIQAISFSTPNISWWPREINKELLIKGRAGLKLYKFNRVIQYADTKQKIVPAFFVIDWTSNTAYYWQYSS